MKSTTLDCAITTGAAYLQISSWCRAVGAGGLRYTFKVCYGVGKQALDHIGADTAIDLHHKNVAVITLWPGTVRTEEKPSISTQKKAASLEYGRAVSAREFLGYGESIEYSGKPVVALATDPMVMSKTPRI